LTETLPPASEVARSGRPRDPSRDEAIFAATLAVFAEDGYAGVSIEGVAARAGVGKATIYRSFPTKDHLIAAVAADRHRWLTEEAEKASAADDTWIGFCDLIQAWAAACAEDRSLAETMDAAAEIPEAQGTRLAMRDALDRLLGRCRDGGSIRSDISTDDIRIFLVGTAHALRNEPELAAAWTRCAAAFLRSVAA
jgi:AcrR family transcriptional regulator